MQNSHSLLLSSFLYYRHTMVSMEFSYIYAICHHHVRNVEYFVYNTNTPLPRRTPPHHTRRNTKSSVCCTFMQVCSRWQMFPFLLSTLICASSYVSSKNLRQSRQSHIGCICLASFHCAFSSVSSNCLPQKRHSHIGCICLTFLHCAF